jgi:hypothetical protein
VQAQAQAYPQPQAPVSHFHTRAELDQMLAPIALYPDALLSQVLMAATYPIEVAEAARWTRANPGLQGDDAVRAVQGEDWDPSVKSLVAFPEILQRMEERPEWTQALGDAFLAQQAQVMDQVQRLRQRAEARGNLRSDERIRVVHEGPVIVVRPSRPEYVYVPYYDPLEVYGTWWWPDYRPVYWAPWPGYVRPRPSYAFWWGRPVGLSGGFFFGNFDWRQRYVRVAYPNSYYYRAPTYADRSFVADRGRWQHDPQHRRGMDYRQAEVRQRFAGAQVERRADRQPSQFQAQPGARTQLQAQPQAQAPAFTERRAQRQASPAVTPAQPRPEQRDDRRAERQAAIEAQRQARQQAQEGQRQAQQQQAQQAQRQAQQQQAQQAQRQAQQQARQQAQEGQRQAQQQARQQAQAARQEQRAATPAAQAPQQARAERREQPKEKREHRGEHEKG